MKWEKMDVDLKQQKSNRFPWIAFPKTRLGFRLSPQKSQTSFPGLLSQGSRLGFRFVPLNRTICCPLLPPSVLFSHLFSSEHFW